MPDAAHFTTHTNTQSLRETPAAYAFQVAAGLIIILGTLVRLRQYLANRSLWLDEAALAVSIVGRSYRGLVGHLENSQVAPTAFLFLEKAATQLLGNNEFGLRLVPLMGGILSLILFHRLAQRYLSPGAGLIALAMFVLSPTLIYYASEVKPYSTDVTVTLAILLAESSVVHSHDDFRSLRWLGLVGAIGIVLSLTSVFVLAGFVLVWIPYRWLSTDRRIDPGLIIVCGCWLAILLPTYLMRSKPDAWIYAYWESGFLPSPPYGIEGLRWLIHAPFNGMDVETLGLAPFWLMTSMFCIGCGSLWGTGRKGLALLLSPIAIALMAALLRLYPMSAGRLLLYLAPSYLIAIGAGLSFLYKRAWPMGSVCAFALTMVLLLPAFRNAMLSLRHPPGHEEIKPVLDYIAASGESGDEIYVYGASLPAFDFYTHYSTKYQFSDMKVVRGRSVTLDAALYESDLQKLRGLPRVWIVITHWRHRTDALRRVGDHTILLAILDRMGKRLASVNDTDAEGYLYNMAN